jgi:hypothetical protein
MPTLMTPPALAGAGAMDQVPMLRAAATSPAIQRRECSEIFLKLSMLAFELKSCGRHDPYGQNMQAHPLGNPRPSKAIPLANVRIKVPMRPMRSDGTSSRLDQVAACEQASSVCTWNRPARDWMGRYSECAPGL